MIKQLFSYNYFTVVFKKKVADCTYLLFILAIVELSALSGQLPARNAKKMVQTLRPVYGLRKSDFLLIAYC